MEAFLAIGDAHEQLKVLKEQISSLKPICLVVFIWFDLGLIGTQ